MLTDLLKSAVHRWSFFSSLYDRLFSRAPNNFSSFHQKLLNIFILAMIEKNGIANSKIRPLWQALIILNYGVISTYYFERNNVLMCLLHASLMAGSRTLRVCECPQPDTRVWWSAFTSVSVTHWSEVEEMRCDGTWYNDAFRILPHVFYILYIIYLKKRQFKYCHFT